MQTVLYYPVPKPPDQEIMTRSKHCWLLWHWQQVNISQTRGVGSHTICRPIFYWFTDNLLRLKVHGYHPPTKLHLYSKLQFRHFSVFEQSSQAGIQLACACLSQYCLCDIAGICEFGELMYHNLSGNWMQHTKTSANCEKLQWGLCGYKYDYLCAQCTGYHTQRKA